MYRWCREAERCFVCLADVTSAVPDGDHDGGERAWLPAFRASRWFTRGWTLQELVAPAIVEFYTAEGVYLGDKTSLVQEIHDITKIGVDVLLGVKPLSGYSVDERMAWTMGRTTKRREDAAYCMLGIFDVQMPLIYGEGRDKAFTRLRREIALQSGSDMDFTTRAFSTVSFSREPDFVERPEILSWIGEMCAAPASRASLVGFGGAGYVTSSSLRFFLIVQSDRAVGNRKLRSSTVTASARRRPKPFIFRVHGGTRSRFKDAYRDIADKLELPRRDNPDVDILKPCSYSSGYE
jgi:hypothetical protein